MKLISPKNESFSVKASLTGMCKRYRRKENEKKRQEVFKMRSKTESGIL